MFRVIWRRRGVRSRGASSNWMDSDPPKATGKKQHPGSKCPTNDGFQHFSGSKKMQFFVKIAEFSRKFALKVRGEPYGVGVTFFSPLNARLFKRSQVARGSYNVELPRELRWRLLKVALFGCISLKILTFLIFFLHFLEGPFNSSLHYAHGLSSPTKILSFVQFLKVKM